MMSPLVSPPGAVRPCPWTRQAGVCVFLFLVLLICVEPRVAELDLVPVVGVVLENDESLDGAEILDRLVCVDDIQVPQPPDIGRLPISYVVLPALPAIPDGRVFTQTSRAPPARPFPG